MFFGEDSPLPKAREIIRKNLPHLTIVEDRKKDNFLTPADPGPQGLWEKSCNPVKFFPDDYCTDSDWSDNSYSSTDCPL